MSLEWDKLYKLGTDVAAFMLYHPKRLAHRKESPIDWWSNDFAAEFRDGLLVTFQTGSDGSRTLKFVRRPLTPSETRALVTQAAFRYLAQDGRLYWDNGDALPSTDQLNEAEDDQNGVAGVARRGVPRHGSRTRLALAGGRGTDRGGRHLTLHRAVRARRVVRCDPRTDVPAGVDRQQRVAR